jgi:SAM-dependent methyltransferase
MKHFRHLLLRIFDKSIFLMGRWVKTPVTIFFNSGASDRKLEIGPGAESLPGFETLNVKWRGNTNYVADASQRLPFPNNTFQLIYASHVLEHIPWYLVRAVLADWNRVLSSGGHLEVWVPNGLKIAKAFVDAETEGGASYAEDGWYKFNREGDSCVWANGRIFSYGDGTGYKDHPNWHMSLFSPRWLQLVMGEAGFDEIEELDPSEVRGYSHGWINMGYRGRKK